ncbi:modification methylase [Brevibacillus brevis]|uniref:modification methylase n=1 Tax=Brevibacillus brevis TaxID=1393 RepID=UPI001ED9DAA7|nr:modification methylase [Brevibacillus brevis]UKK97266.1 modification methylase [Brevibacillus brevis]
MRNIAFKEYRKKSDIHGTVLYPAVMVAPVQKNILSDLINKQITMKIFDPFHGSGTSLYEAMEISNNVHLVGCDINPLANLITLVKLQGVSKDILSDIEEVKRLLVNSSCTVNHSFHNIEKWFRKDIIHSLSHVRACIIQINNKQNRLYFWCMLCDIVRKYSNSRSSTYKLHTKKVDDINKMENNVVGDFVKSIESNWVKFQKNFNNFTLYKENTLSIVKEFPANEFDICITSPPYGENSTTVPYGQFSTLPLFWINNNDLEMEGWELDNFSIIDSKSMGGGFSQGKEGKVSNDLLTPYLNSISILKQKKVLRFFSDYFFFLDEMCRVTKTYIIMTLGNRTVDGVKIDLTDITVRYLVKKGFLQKEVMEREIVSKRIPRKVSRVHSKPVSSMNKEYVIVMQKGDSSNH